MYDLVAVMSLLTRFECTEIFRWREKTTYINVDFMMQFLKTATIIFRKKKSCRQKLQLQSLIASCHTTFKVKYKTKLDNAVLKYPLSRSIDSFSMSLLLHSWRRYNFRNHEDLGKSEIHRKAWHKFAHLNEVLFVTSAS